ncbi:MAG: mechanosensitive ion channel [Proteobacteria bacterium]|nr:mechanosensitive ion channel [Pseudomonadota bacterium]MBU1611764.1 mechanosensitive ion channel [Pseudomonadota bacterium]
MDIETIAMLKEEAILWLATNGMNLLIALLILLVGWVIAKKIASSVRTMLEKKGMELTLSGFLQGVVFWALMIVVLMASASHMGLDLTSFLAILATMGLAIGLAIKDNISNLSSGVILILTRPFVIGDAVQVAGVTGVVQKIGLSTTILHTPDNQKILVPNAHILGAIITNITANDTRRIDLVVGIGYEDDIDQARTVIENVLNTTEGVLKTPTATVAIGELADSSVNFVVRPWSKTDDYWTVRCLVIEGIKKALDQAGISIPYPQTDVHLHTIEQ